ncbi:PREDICTED: uncharacterized protein LOC106742156 [Dinoponera quadriceps]|uniref:Uncharacterized protein LOC106742156 n=1 Tax=Dinoponera quadriceps TaxID=609295 RepID=A0A6P3WWP9_DINQU|nr:PREDICTED: uncharacterized protein LOC106742156 [Dinoponera quadriceps]
MAATLQIPCTFEFSRGNGTGVAEAIGNWGFSNRVFNAGHELQRIKCLFAKMDSLRKPSAKPVCVKYDCRYDPEAWHVKPSPEECKPAWRFPINRPLITYTSTATSLKVASLINVGTDLDYVIPGRTYVQQGTPKWYRRGPDGCCQPSCLAPQCPVLRCPRYNCC